MPELYANNAHGVLNAGIGTGDTSLTLDTGEGALFPNPTTADFFRSSLERLDGTATEIVFVTARSGDTFTIVRAQEGTTAATFIAGDRVRLRPTAGMLEAIASVIEADDESFLHAWCGGGDIGGTMFGVSLTASGGTRTIPVPTDTSHRASMPGLISTSTADAQILGFGIGTSAGRVTRGSGTSQGRFDLTWRFGVPNDLTGMYGYWGLDDNNASTYTGGSPEGRTTVEQIGVGWASSSTAGDNFFVFTNDGSAPVTSVDTGIARDETSVFELRLYAEPNDSLITLTFTNITTGEVFSADYSTNFPAAASFLVSRHTASGANTGAIELFGYWRFNVNQSEPVVE